MMQCHERTGKIGKHENIYLKLILIKTTDFNLQICLEQNNNIPSYVYTPYNYLITSKTEILLKS